MALLGLGVGSVATAVRRDGGSIAVFARSATNINVSVDRTTLKSDILVG